MKDFVINEHISGQEIRELRTILNMTQKDFAAFARVSLRTVENWERTDEITGPIVTLAEILKRQPKLAEKLEVPPKGRGLRLWYYFGNMVCSVIDADEVSREIKVYNFTDKPLYRAFGVNTEPTFEQYEEFLEERCFPKTRDKMKLELKRLGIPFYDPILIIEKTEGRMAGDQFWIRIER